MHRVIIAVAATALSLTAPGPAHGQSVGATRLVYDQAHGQQPPPPPLGASAKALGLELHVSTVPITPAALRGQFTWLVH